MPLRYARTADANACAQRALPRGVSSLALAILTWLTCSGCPSISGPGYVHPGDAQYQRGIAQRFDPYPLPDAGPPTYSRPLGYERPAPENEQMQNMDSYVKHYGGQLPLAPTFRQPRWPLKHNNAAVPEVQAVPGSPAIPPFPLQPSIEIPGQSSPPPSQPMIPSMAPSSGPPQ